MYPIKFLRIPDSDFTFHYEMREGPDELVESQRNIRKNIGPKGQENNKK